VTCTPEERRYSVTARPQLRKEALLGNGWPQQYTGQSFLWGQVPGYKPPREVVIKRDRNRDIQRSGDQEIGVFDIL
jgi:hypothetical protein